jgi:hypothetical protein
MRFHPSAAILVLVPTLLAGGPPPRAGEEGGNPPAAPEPKNEFKIGDVTCFKKERRIEVPGKICLQEGSIEFLAVFIGGKEYESVMSFNCKAVDLNLALLGLGYKPGGNVKRAGDPDVPKGDPVYLNIEWKDGDKVRRVRAEELLFNVGTKKPMRSTAWVFSGSDFVRDPDHPEKLFIDPDTHRTVFLADAYRMFIAVWRDPAAIFNCPLDTGVDGIYYTVNKELCPKVGTAVKLTIEPAPADSLKPENLKDGADLIKRNDGSNYEPTKKPDPEKDPKDPKEPAPAPKPGAGKAKDPAEPAKEAGEKGKAPAE